MKIAYTGKSEVFPPKERAKFEGKLQKLSKVLEQRGEKDTHVVLSHERFLHKVEITVNAWGHAVVGIGSNGEIAVAAQEALDRLEKQLLKLRAKWRDNRRERNKEADGAKASASLQAPVAEPPKSSSKAARKATVGNKAGRKQVFRVSHSENAKPMTLEEAMLEIEASEDYLVYRDAKTDRVTVLMRRSDGHFDLIES